jgi:CO dehydrogenase maturation factor
VPGIKVAISGKGGVGKSTLAACIARTLVKRGKIVCAVDADPDANLASALGMPQEVKNRIRPIALEKSLIEERTGAQFGKTGQLFSLSPDVSDVASRFGVSWEGLSLVVLGAVTKGGSGCACPENSFLRALVRRLVLHEGECLVIDMEPVIEHLGRATAAGVDAMIVVLEPGTRSRESGRRIAALSADIGLGEKLFFVLNKMRDGVEPQELVPGDAPSAKIAGEVPFDERFLDADRKGAFVLSLPGTGDLASCFETITDELTRSIHGD